MRLVVTVVTVTGTVFALAASPAGAVDPLSPTGAPVPPSVAKTIAGVEGKARYMHSTWGLFVADAKTGKALISQNPEKLFTPGSTLKLYSAATVLHDYGPGHRFRTPVFRTGRVRGGVLSGNLILLERSLGEVKRRTKVIGRFPGEDSCLSLVWAVLDLVITNETNGIRFTELDRQHLNRVRYSEPDDTIPEEVDALAAG